MVNWPSFESVSFSADELNALRVSGEAAHTLTSVGVPKEFFGARFKAESHLSEAHTPEGRVVCFGTTGLSGRVGLDVATGEVVQLAGTGHPRTFVNSSLRQFVETIRSVLGRFPFHTVDATQDEIESAAQGVAKLILEMDAPAMNRDQFWSTLVEDIGMGDFDLELMGLSDS